MTASFAEAMQLPDGEETLFHYAQWHLGDYIAGTLGMSLETEGAYMRFLVRLYQRGKPLPDDDRFMSTAMALSLRIWKRIKAELVTLGKIVIRAGCLTNGRFESERQKRAAEIRKRSNAAQKRWSSAETSPKFAPSLGQTSAKLSANSAKKVNEINDAPVEVHMLTNNQNPITINQKQQQLSVVSQDQIDGLNGATVLMQNAIAGWMRPLAPDYRCAREWLTNTVAMFGSDAVRDAFASIQAKQASGDIVGHPLKLMTAICQGKAKDAEKTNQPAARYQSASDRRREKAKEDHDWAASYIAELKKEVAVV